MSTTSPLILADGVTKRFGANQVLTRVSLEVLERDVVCVVGPSGSGKTTLLRCLALLEEPSEGRVVMEGVPISTPSPDKQVKAAAREVRSEIGMVFQHFNLWPHKLAIENVTEGLIRVRHMAGREAGRIAAELLARVGLGAKLMAFPNHLSGGQRQRVAIARALAMRPDIMLFDEPTSALDPELVGEVLQVLEDVAASGMTMLVATHEMGFARRVADRIVFMDGGKIVEIASAADFFERPQHERSIRFLEAVLK